MVRKTRMHSSRMRTARLLTVSQHALPWGVPARGVPAQVLHPPVNRMIDRCKNITLPQTSFAGGKYIAVLNLTSIKISLFLNTVRITFGPDIIKSRNFKQCLPCLPQRK